MKGAGTASSSSDSTTDLEVRIRKRYSDPNRSFDLNVHFRLGSGFTILFGASGAGKTTILDCIAGLNDPDHGRITLGGNDLFDSERRHSVPPWKRRVGYVLQDLALFPHLNVRANIEYGMASLPKSQRQNRSREILSAFRIDHLREQFPGQISGGEQQRVALARALVTEPRVLLLDEPLAGLDRPTKSHIFEDLRTWNEAHRVPILYVTHSSEEVFTLGEQVIVVDSGRIIVQGAPHEVMHAPRLETVAQLSGFENIFDARVEAIHEDRGTLTCKVEGSSLQLETPLVLADVGSRLRVGIRAGDLLLATEAPRGLSARNLLTGVIRRLEQRDVIVSALVDCGGMELEVHLTLAAREALHLCSGKKVWVVVKTHSCHLMSA